MTPDDADRFEDILRHRFGGRVERRLVRDGLYRFAVVSPRFEGLAMDRRIDLAWDAALDLGDDALVGVSAIYTHAPSELAEDDEEPYRLTDATPAASAST